MSSGIDKKFVAARWQRADYSGRHDPERNTSDEANLNILQHYRRYVLQHHLRLVYYGMRPRGLK
jgi:hypothetical protein